MCGTRAIAGRGVPLPNGIDSPEECFVVMLMKPFFIQDSLPVGPAVQSPSGMFR